MVQLEREGIPTVTLSTNVFELAAKTRAKMLGIPNLPLIVVRCANSGDSSEYLESRVGDIFQIAVEVLTGELEPWWGVHKLPRD